MIKHIVFFKLSEEGIKQQDEIIVKLNNLKNEIEFIRGLEVGVNFAQEDRAFDLSLTVVVDNKEALNAYAIHEKHIPVVAFIKTLAVESKVVDYEMEKYSNDNEFGNSTIIKKANIYFDGQVTSRTVIQPDGSKKTLGIMNPGTYTFGTELAEHMEILAGEVEVILEDDSNVETVKGGEYFEIPANSKFDIKVKTITDYCCTYIS